MTFREAFGVLDKIPPLCCNTNEVSLCLFETCLTVHENLKGDVRNLPAVSIFIQVLEEFIKRLKDTKMKFLLEVQKEVNKNMASEPLVPNGGPRNELEETRLVFFSFVKEMGDSLSLKASNLFDSQIKRAESLLERAQKI